MALLSTCPVDCPLSGIQTESICEDSLPVTKCINKILVGSFVYTPVCHGLKSELYFSFFSLSYEP